jgi:hypothetical protein
VPAGTNRRGDTNDYLQDAGVPMPTAEGGIDTIVAVQDEVSRRLCAPDRRHCTYGANGPCPRTPSVAGDNPASPDCFLISRNPR